MVVKVSAILEPFAKKVPDLSDGVSDRDEFRGEPHLGPCLPLFHRAKLAFHVLQRCIHRITARQLRIHGR